MSIKEYLAKWQGKQVKMPRYPHVCRECKSPALIMFHTVECSGRLCPHYHP